MKSFTFIRNAALSFFLLNALLVPRLFAQNPITWDSPPPSCSWGVVIGSNSVSTGASYTAPASPCGAVSKNVLPSCRVTGNVTGKLGASYLAAMGSDEIVMLSLDQDGVTYNPADYAITLTASAGGVYTLKAGKQYQPLLLSWGALVYNATITPAAGDIYKIERNETTVTFYRNNIPLGAVPASPLTDLKVMALILPYGPGSVSDINSNFGTPDLCGNVSDDDDWKGAGTGTMSPYNSNDNVYVPAKIGIGVASPAEKLEVNGKVKISTIDNDNALTKLLVADATGLVKYRDLTSLPEALDWRTTAGNVPTSLNDQIYKNGRVGLNTSTVNATLHVVNGACDNLPAFRVSDNACDLSCLYPNTNGDLVYVENCVGMSSLTPALVVKQSGATCIGTGTPVDKLTVSSSVQNDGIRVIQTGSGFAGLRLENQTTGGKQWGLLSLGAANTQGPGNFLIYNYSGGGSTFLIDGATGNTGIGTTTPGTYKLYINGNTYTTGSYSSSDRRFKKDIVPVRDALKLISSLEGVRYTFKDDMYYPQSGEKDEARVKRNFPQGPQIGLIAQDVEKVLPEVVHTDDDGYKAIAYQNMVALLIEGIKEQEQKIEALERRLEALESGKAGNTRSTAVDAVQGTTDASRLGQSLPNPTGNTAEIPYHLAKHVTKASIVLYTSDGVEVNRYSLTPNGDGRITVEATTLKNGVYLYSLITNEGIVDTKKMTVAR